MPAEHTSDTSGGIAARSFRPPKSESASPTPGRLICVCCTSLFVGSTRRPRSIFALVEHRHRHSSREAGVDLVEIGDSVFAQLPAQVNFAPLMAADEIDQAVLKILQFTA